MHKGEVGSIPWGAIRKWIALAVQASLLLVGLIVSATVQAQAVCDSGMYLSQLNTLYDVNTATNPFTYTAIGSANSYAYNGGDFNPADGFLYGFRANTTSNNLVRIDPNTGVVTSLGNVTGLPSTNTYLSGAFNPTNGLFYAMPGGSGNTIYAINVSSTPPAVVSTITLSGSVNTADFAFVNGTLYAVANATGNLVSINVSTGALTVIGNTGFTNVFFGGMVGAPNGLFGFNNNGGFYQFNLTTGATTLISSAPASNNNEAYHCPTANVAFGADLSVIKTDGKTTYTPGGTNTYTIVVTNSGPFGAANQVFTDPAIANLTITSVTCASPTGGATCPTAANTTVALMQGSGIVIPSLPYSGSTPSSVTFTVTGTVAAGATGNLSNVATVNPTNTVIDPNLGNNTFTDTDTSVPVVKVAKQSLGGVGTFNFTLAGLSNTTDTVTTATSGTTVTSAQNNFGTVGTAATLTETAVAGYTTTSSCSDSTGGQTAISGGTTAITIPAASMVTNSTWTCTFVNTKTPVLLLQKSLPNGRFNAADQFTLSIAGTGAPAPVTTTGSGTTATGSVTVNPATIGSAYTLSETAAGGGSLGNYVTTYTCTNTLSGGQTPSGSGTSFSLTPVAGDNLTCTLVNTRNAKVDLSITKSNGTTSVVSGTTTTYTIVASNAGPDAANGAVVKDPAVSGLNCATVTCSATGGAVCPAAPMVTTLQGSGLIVPTFPANSSLTFILTCTVQ